MACTSKPRKTKTVSPITTLLSLIEDNGKVKQRTLLSLGKVGENRLEDLSPRIQKEVLDLKEKQNNLRRGLFQRYDIMKKEIEWLKQQVESLKNERVNNADITYS